MKSKSFESKPSSAEKKKVANSYDFLDYNNVNKPFDFVGLYKSAAETSKILEKHKSVETYNKDTIKNKVTTQKRERSPYKKKKNNLEPLDISQINIDATSLTSGVGANAEISNPKVTSTPNASRRNQGAAVKSIMKNSSFTDQSVSSARSNVSSAKPKKRNKSVSFMLDDNEEVVIKRTKSDDNIKVDKKTVTTKPNIKERKSPVKKIRKDQQSEKENKTTNVNKENMEVDISPSVQDTKPSKGTKAKKAPESVATAASAGEPHVQEKKKKFKKIKKHKVESNSETMETENNNEVTTEAKSKKPKKKKQIKHVAIEKVETGDGDGEPARKSRKKDPKPDIAENLENLSIGDNAHTLTNLLDEMTVVDKEKRKKLKHKTNKNKRPKGPPKDDSEKSEEVKEKVKWKKRKWNKDKKGEVEEDVTTVIIENLPLGIMLNYKKLLSEHFSKCGLIKKIGIAEVYPTEESKPVFTTTINFYSDGAAELALEKNNTEFEGSRIRVKRPLPATATTVVVHSYAELNDQNISSTFLGAGKIRSIRHLVKGKKAMSTAFVEFHGPEAVDSAIKMAADTKIGGKKMHVAKFEPRPKKKKMKKPKSDGDSAADADSEDSND